MYSRCPAPDSKAVIGQFQFAELQAISYSITREKAPVYTMESADVRAYSRNQRGIAGSLIWINFDRQALLALFQRAKGKFVADKDEIRPQYQESTVDGSAIFTSSRVRDLGPSFGPGSTIDQLDTIELSDVGSLNELATPWYSDQILPFDITLCGVNEYGASAAAKIFGIEILNEGTGHSIDDAVAEMQATFVARAIEPMAAVQNKSTRQVGVDVLPDQNASRAGAPETGRRRARGPRCPVPRDQRALAFRIHSASGLACVQRATPAIWTGGNPVYGLETRTGRSQSVCLGWG
jgi:hypothetical protein